MKSAFGVEHISKGWMDRGLNAYGRAVTPSKSAAKYSRKLEASDKARIQEMKLLRPRGGPQGPKSTSPYTPSTGGPSGPKR